MVTYRFERDLQHHLREQRLGNPVGRLPNGRQSAGQGPFHDQYNGAGATYFDDIGWWTWTWLAAYKFAGNLDYLYLAEELWNYATNNGYHWDADTQGQTADPGVGCGGMVQYHNPNHTSPQPVIGPEDTFANAPYLRKLRLAVQHYERSVIQQPVHERR